MVGDWPPAEKVFRQPEDVTYWTDRDRSRRTSLGGFNKGVSGGGYVPLVTGGEIKNMRCMA